MATPALRYLGRKEPVNVFFADKNIQKLYKKCPFIKIIQDEPSNKPFATTSTGKKYRTLRETDSESLFRVVVGDVSLMEQTYVDYEITKKIEKDKNKKYVAIFHGCLGEIYRYQKDIGSKTRQYMINAVLAKGWVPVILGSQRDAKIYWAKNKTKHCLNFLGKLSLKDSVSILGQCDLFMSNDTGLYHIAGALDMTGLVLWKQTDVVRSRSTCSNISHARDRKGQFSIYKRYIDGFLNQIK